MQFRVFSDWMHFPYTRREEENLFRPRNTTTGMTNAYPQRGKEGWDSHNSQYTKGGERKYGF